MKISLNIFLVSGFNVFCSNVSIKKFPLFKDLGLMGQYPWMFLLFVGSPLKSQLYNEK